MSSSIGIEVGKLETRDDILSAAEEGVLSHLREIVAGIRARGLAADVGSLKDAINGTCASVFDCSEESDSSNLRLGSVQFSLRFVRQEVLEINFPASNS